MHVKCVTDINGCNISTPLFLEKLFSPPRSQGGGQSSGKVREEEWSGDVVTGVLAQVNTRRHAQKAGQIARFLLSAVVCTAQPLGVTTVAHGWQSLCKFCCQAEAQWSFEITALCNKDPCSPQQLVSAHRHCCVKLHQEARQLCSQSDHLTSHMLHVHKPTEGPYISTWQIVSCYFF